MDKFFADLKNAAGKVAKKSTELYELSRVKLSIASTKSEIDACFKTLGSIVYHSQRSETEPDADTIEATLSKIDELYEKLEELTELSSHLKNEKLCPVCTKSNAKDAQFCSDCGYRFTFEEYNTESEDETVVEE